MKTFKRLLSYAKPLKGFIPTYVLLSLLYSFFGVFNLVLFIPLLQILFQKNTVPEVLVEPVFQYSIEYLKERFYYKFYLLIETQGESSALLAVCGIMVLAVFSSNVFLYLGQRILGKLNAIAITKLREEAFNKIISLHLGFFSGEKKGDLISRLTTDIQQAEDSIQFSFRMLLREPFMVIFSFGALFYIHPQLSLFTLIVLPVSGALIGVISRKLRKSSKMGQESQSHVLSLIDESISGLRVVKAFNGEGYINRKFKHHNNYYRRILQTIVNLRELASPISQFMGVIVVSVILIYGGNKILDAQEIGGSTLTGESFLAFIVIFAMLLQPLKDISRAISYVQRGLASADRVFHVIDQKTKIFDKKNPNILETFSDKIELKNVVFQYEKEGAKILNKIDLVIPKGKTIALVGPSGGGKSTLIDLIPRFHDPIKGSIEIDGVNIKDYSLFSLREQMGIVTQESILFNDTVKNNIAFGIGASDEDIEKAARIANAHNFIVNLDKGYNTSIGDRGNNLSGGQRQRLTIARAVLANPPILLLDEATSALDSESEHLVQEALNNLMKNRTSIIIAHRLSTIQSADEIIVLDKGEIAERGTHDELMSSKGIYFKLQEMQSH